MSIVNMNGCVTLEMESFFTGLTRNNKIRFARIWRTGYMLGMINNIKIYRRGFVRYLTGGRIAPGMSIGTVVGFSKFPKVPKELWTGIV